MDQAMDNLQAKKQVIDDAEQAAAAPKDVAEFSRDTRVDELLLTDAATSSAEMKARWKASIEESDRNGLISPIVLSGVYRFFELLVLGVVGLGGYLVYVPAEQSPHFSYYLLAVAAVCALSALVLHAVNVYSIQAFNSPIRQTPKLWLGLTMVFAIFIAGIFFLKLSDSYSRLWLGAWYVLGVLSLLFFRFAFASVLKQWCQEGRIYRRAVVVGGGDEAVAVIRALNESPTTDIRICGVFDERGDERVPDKIEGYPKLGNYDELVEFGRQSRIDLLIVTLPLRAEGRIMTVLKKLWVLPVDIRLAAHTTKLRFRPRAYSYIGNVPFIDILDKPLADWDFVLKWLFDKVVASIALLLLAPVMLGVALAVKLTSKGPVLFRQKRYGFNNDLIEVYKFRSMYTDMTDASAAKLVTKDDPRVTPVGRFIRRSSLDELPQLFNVLKGELSLVGPRPHALQAKAASQNYHDVVDGYFARHRVKPGITGWAQINGWRGETDTEEKIQKRVEFDLYYIENWSIFLDIFIIAKTPFSLLFNNDNAY